MSLLSNRELLEIYNKRNKRLHLSTTPKPEKLWNDAEVLWSGDHYLMIREGPHLGARLTYLVSREGLLLDWGNPDKNPLVELALAAIHPCHLKDLWNRRELLHCSKADHVSGKNPRFKDRMSPTLQLDMMLYATKRDEAFREEEVVLKAEFDEAMARSRETAVYVQNSLKLPIHGKHRYLGYEFPVGAEMHVDIAGVLRLHWRASRFSDQISARLTLRERECRFSPEQFKKLVDVLSTIQEHLPKKED